MSQTEGYSRGRCKNCGGHIEFPAEGIGRTVTCPHCNWPTLLAPDSDPKEKSRALHRRISLIVIIALITAGVYWYKNRQIEFKPIVLTPVPPARSETTNKVPLKRTSAPPARPDPWHGLMPGKIKLEKTGEGDLVYAVGTLRNATTRERFGVKVQLDVFDAGKQKVGAATDYTASIEPGKDWKFKALVVDRTAKTAKIVAVTEN